MSSVPEALYFAMFFGGHDVVPRGVVYAGAHKGELIPVFLINGAKHILAIEPNPNTFSELAEQQSTRIRCVHGAISDREATKTYYAVEGESMLNSLFEPDLPKLLHDLGAPKVTSFDVQCFTLNQLLEKDHEKYNVLYMNLQGGELDAMRGATNYLRGFDGIITEINYTPRYQGAPVFDEVDAFLRENGFVLKQLRTSMAPTGGRTEQAPEGDHGEACYARRSRPPARG